MQEDAILQWFSQYAYQPGLVYAAIAIIMLASSFGFPAPEEITLVSAGLVGYMGSRPDLYPPPYPGAPSVNVYLTAGIAFFSVFFSDFLVFLLGRKFGRRLLRSKLMLKYEERMDKIGDWTRRYGYWAAGFFRFTPGLRFPGHFACGMMGLSPTRFLAVDGGAALVSVPTQVLLVAFFGETILVYLRQFKIVLGIVILIALVVFLVRRLLARRRAPA